MKFFFNFLLFTISLAAPAQVERSELDAEERALANEFFRVCSASMISQSVPSTNNRRDISFSEFRQIYLNIINSANDTSRAVKILRYASQQLNGPWSVPDYPEQYQKYTLEGIINQELNLSNTNFIPEWEVSNTEIPVLYTANSPEIAPYSICGNIQVDAGNEANVMISSAAIGRVPGVDFFIENNDVAISRISFIIVAIPGKAVIVMDMGSVSGIYTLDRQREDVPKEHSTIESRK